MKAILYNQFGPANEVLELQDVEITQPGPGEVLVRLHRSGVNPSDTKKRAGAAPTLLDNGYVIPNSDGAGVIEAVGEGVDAARVGERVWVFNGQFGRRFGTSAEYITLDAKQAVFLPDNTSFDIGACTGIPIMTAHRCVTTDGPVEGKLVLVTGGAGRVGHYAIQWAKRFGATVIATASSDRSRQACLEAGADLVVGHPSPESNAEIMAFTEGKKIQHVVEGDFGVNVGPLLDILATSAVIATYSSMTVAEPALPFRRMMFMDLTIRLVIVYAMPWSAKALAIQDITEAFKDNGLIHRIAGTYPLAESAAAHQAIETGNQYGCVLLEC